MKANGKFNFYDSDYSKEYKFKKLSAVTELSHLNGSITWKINELASSYIVKINNQISGKIKFENMLDDKYYYDYEKRAIIGQKTKKKYQIGNKIYVIVKDASKENRTINFETGMPKKRILTKE